MICKIQVVTVSEDGRKETREITSIQRTDVKQETLGLTLAEGKMILKDLQQVVVESQVSSLLLPKRTCPECGEPRCSKGNHTLSVRTVFGRLTVRSPRLYHCVCRPHDTKTFSPLAELLPNHTLPELLFLETKWASLMSYGMTSKLLQDVLPIDEPVNTFIIRQHVEDVAERLEQESVTARIRMLLIAWCGRRGGCLRRFCRIRREETWHAEANTEAQCRTSGHVFSDYDCLRLVMS